MIAIDATSNGTGTTVSSLTVSHTCSGSDRILIVATRTGKTGTPPSVSGVTYNGKSLTNINEITNGSGNTKCSLWYLIGPDSGTYNVVVTADATADNFFVANASYTGAKQSGQPDSNNTGESGDTTVTVSTNVVASNCWLVGCAVSPGSVITASTNAYKRVTLSSDNLILLDSNGTVGTGSTAMAYTVNYSSYSDLIVASVSPLTTALPRRGNFLTNFV